MIIFFQLQMIGDWEGVASEVDEASGAVHQVSFSQRYIFFNTHLAQWITVLYYDRWERPAWDKHPSLLDPFVNYKEN
jgi:hypothetical protein